MEGTIKEYRLVGDYKPVSWEVRKRALVFKEGEGLREIIYIEGGHSIWKDDYPKNIQLKSKEIWFDDGTLLVKATNPLLSKYLEKHPDFNVKFKLHDPQKDAVLKLEKIKKQDRVKDELSKLKDYDALADALSRKDESTLHLTAAEKELKCYEEAQKNPDKVLEAIADPNTTTKYLVTLALSKNIIKLDTAKTKAMWADSDQVITTLVHGKKASEVIAEFLFEPKNEGTLAELIKRVDTLNKPKTRTRTKKVS